LRYRSDQKFLSCVNALLGTTISHYFDSFVFQPIETYACSEGGHLRCETFCIQCNSVDFTVQALCDLKKYFTRTNLSVRGEKNVVLKGICDLLAMYLRMQCH